MKRNISDLLDTYLEEDVELEAETDRKSVV